LEHLGGGIVFNPFDDDFFNWWALWIPTIDDYPYTGIDFSQDPNMIVPPSITLGNIGHLYRLYYLIYKKIYLI
jgi:hypothetical protein